MSNASLEPGESPERGAEKEGVRALMAAGGTSFSFKTVAPWLVAIAIFVWIFRSSDLGAMRASAADANWPLFWASMIGLYLVLFLVDSACVWWVYRRYHVPQITLRDVLPARGASYFLGILNYAAGSAAMALYFKRKFGVGMVQGGASLLLLMLIDLGLVVIAVLVGGSALPAESEAIRPWIQGIGVLFLLGALAHLVFWRAPWSWGPLEAIRALPQLSGFREATLLDYAILGAIRAPVTAIYIAMHVLTLAAFAVHPPFARMLVYVPIQMLIAVIPVSPSGLGTVQAAQRILYEPYATDATIVAYGLALAFGFNLPRLIIGFLSLAPAGRAMAASSTPDVTKP